MEEIAVGSYLFARLKELGIKTVFGVPGDFELLLLDLVEPAGLDWVGNTNELNAAYAADGYARVNGAGALITTFGPGELSALCGIGGAYSELVPVLHIVGYPTTKAQSKGLDLHHTLGTGKYDMYHEMSKHISCATTVILDAESAASEIDRVINTMIQSSQPAYIGLPSDIGIKKISARGLQTPLIKELFANDPHTEAKAVSLIREKLERETNPVLIVDGGATRDGLLSECHTLIDLLQIPFFSTYMGKGNVDENHTYFGGIYMGELSKEDVAHTVDTAGCVFKIGNYPSDLNTGAFSEKFHPQALIDMRRHRTIIADTTYPVKMRHTLQALIKSFQETPFRNKRDIMPCVPYAPISNPDPAGEIPFDYTMNRLGRFFKPQDLILMETGSCSLGSSRTPMPTGAHMWNTSIWGAIGYSTAAASGAFIASRELSRFARHIIVSGDGAIQLTVQALADILGKGLKPIIFILNNSGYTCERVIHGLNAKYNDITTWDWQTLLHTFGPRIPSKSHRVSTPAELEDLLADGGEVARAEVAHLVEIVLPKYDAGEIMLKLGVVVAKFNKSL